MKPTLLVLAAGMGSRYGGLKQLDGVGPAGETIMEFSIYDAIKAGFGKVVFVIRKSFEKDFRDRFQNLFEDKIEIAYAFQDINVSFDDIEDMPERTKPWGTAHAVLAAKEFVNEPFAVINADDYYGLDAYQLVANFLRDQAAPIERFHQYICYMEGEDRISLAPDTLVSMNLFGFHHSIFEAIETGFEAFVRANYKKPKAEYYIPLVVNEMINNKTMKMSVIPTNATWYGVTYQEDRPTVVAALKELSDAGHYENPLWKTSEKVVA